MFTELTDEQKKLIEKLYTVGPLKYDGSLYAGDSGKVVLKANRETGTTPLHPTERDELLKLIGSWLNTEGRKLQGDIQPANVLHVCDIYENQISPATVAVLRDIEPAYRDQHNSLTEHLYDQEEISDLILDDHDERLTEHVRKELKALSTLLHDYDAGYLRICEI